MHKFKIEYAEIVTKVEEIEALSDYHALEIFRERKPLPAIASVKYVYEGAEELKEYYCRWWNGNTWKSKVVLAHNKEEVEFNIKETLDYCVYEFRCCLNTSEATDSLIRSLID